MQYGCIAERLGHSFSPEIHAELADYRYELCELRPEEVEHFLKRGAFCGINVTIPYKETVIPYLYEIDEAAREIGAVNTVVNRGGRLYGYNTDFYGMHAMIEYMSLALAGKKVAVLGTGGTSRTARAVAASLGAREILVVSRTAREGVITYKELIERHTDTEILINTTPCGMYPHLEGRAVDVSHFPQLAGVLDAVYNPLRPRLVLDAMARGIPACGGLYMLVAQAVRASEIFLDTAYPKDTTARVYRRLLAKKENIVLIGMPGCGKSTVGALLANRLDRDLCDVDAEIVRTAGCSIPAIFEAEGEDGFRNLETRVICEQIAQANTQVIATGGGAILRDENVAALRRNGRLIFLDRPLCDLLPTPDRPLATSAEAICRRYEERYDRYRAVADCIIPVTGGPQDVADAIEKELFGT